MRTALASGAEPVRTEMKPPAWMMRSKAPRSTTRSRMTGKARARNGSTQISSPSLNVRMCSWQVVVADCGPCGTPLIMKPHVPQMPSRQSLSKAIGSSPFAISFSFRMSSISRNEVCSVTLDLVVDELALGLRTRLAPHVQVNVELAHL